MQELVGKPLESSVAPDWREASSYSWLEALPSTAWAWEFLRRNPDYQTSYAQTAEDSRPVSPSAADWGLIRLEDPRRNALSAEVFWQKTACRQVLPLTGRPKASDAAADVLDPTRLACRTTILHRPAEAGQDVLFSHQGRALQLSISGDVPLTEALLYVPVLTPPDHCRARLQAVRRLTDLLVHGTLRPSLYPRERRAVRLRQVLRALDGWLCRASQREIAAAIFGEDRVARDWSHPGNHLRDQVRRAIGSGRGLMSGQYRGFLK